MRLYQFTITVSIFVFSMHIQAAPWEAALGAKGEWTEQPEARNLPPFCGTNPRFKNYKGDFGSAYLNHPCESLVRRPICFNYSGIDKSNCFKAIAKGFLYALNLEKNPNFQLRPYLWCETGLTYFYGDSYREAIDAYSQSIKINQKYTKAYAGLADVYIKLKQYDEASDIIEKGLKQDPRSKKLLIKKEKVSKILKK
ncbi:MAG: tetratricopeptide repeat protein [Methylicorpusculum sp.]|uniref:tetratricopeptide repeat protein n=1 Tax=Methylicorpusculum sp. TaxID=2713644 RepID=UPI00272623D1|nr:tetratricopeptide repeat protein [Methylicorpusculum sp.]MDO8938531.1 tetratricopeptide repeat protein [Methylicorpusculum sp.]MDP2202081.1 tetratricopeptide repeat protein [Methylicorpusculum sp.]